MKQGTPIALLALFLLATACLAQDKPNILLIYADDLGHGDLSCYNDQAKVETAHLDRLAKEGIRFTDAHSPSTVCTPSRYGVMTGRMPFRLDYRGVFTGVEGPCLIADERLTLPEMLSQQGYSTAMFGKWHIGMTFFDADGKPVYEGNRIRGMELVKRADLTKKIKGGPLDHGFDQFFGTACCPTTDWLYAWIDGDRIPVLPEGVRDRDKLPSHPYANDCRPGLIAPDFDMEEVDMVFLEKSKAFLKEHVRNNSEQPFFLFHSTQAVHLPSFAGKDFQGKSNAGPHGDFIFEFDQIVGELLSTLEELGVADNTLVIVTSDNGPEVPTTIHMRADHQHDGARPFRGMKRDQWEGGHRVPFIVRWPGKTPSGTTCDQTICQTDIMQTCAAIVGFELPNDAAEDSFNLLPLFADPSMAEPIRPYTIHQTINLSMAIRKGKWKLLDHQGSGGNNYSRGELQQYQLKEALPDAPAQLYNLETDPGETQNVYDQYPEVVAELKALLEQSKSSGRSRPTR